MIYYKLCFWELNFFEELKICISKIFDSRRCGDLTVFFSSFGNGMWLLSLKWSESLLWWYQRIRDRKWESLGSVFDWAKDLAQANWVSNLHASNQTIKNPPAMQGTQVWSLFWEDPLEEEWRPTPVVLPRESLWTEKPGRVTVHGITKSWTWLRD